MASFPRKKKHIPSSEEFQPLLLEVAWEVCNQVGGIYTVIRSKTPEMVKHYQSNYCLIGPYLNKNIQDDLEPLNDSEDILGQAAASHRKKGYDVHYAQWHITGKPRVVLLNPNAIQDKTLSVVKYLLWKNYGIGTPGDNALINQVIAFGYLTKLFFDELVILTKKNQPIISYFHEWMAGLPILDIKKEKMPVKTVFTTHATQLGRHLAINSPLFYAHLPFFKWEEESKKFGIETEARIEFGCAKHADVLTTDGIEHQHIAHVATRSGVPVGFWRAVGHSHNAFFSEGFIDELAHEAKQDPLTYRLALLDQAPRHAAVLRLVAEKAGWADPLPRARARGLALHESFGSVVATVMEVSIDALGPRVHRVVCALDCGTVVNPGIVAQQIESAVMFGLAAALHGRIDIQRGVVQQRNFPDHPLLTLARTPTVQTHIVPSSAPPGGVGEVGLPPVAPALANALFALTGRRQRTLPLQPG
jgi:hypothetical protein